MPVNFHSENAKKGYSISSLVIRNIRLHMNSKFKILICNNLWKINVNVKITKDSTR